MADHWGRTPLFRCKPAIDECTPVYNIDPQLDDVGSIFRVKVSLPGSMISIVTTSGQYATLLAEMLKDCGVGLEAVEEH